MRQPTIVIADDDSDLVNALRKRCEAIGLHVRIAFDALDALNLIHESEPDMICLDVNMPCGNGLSVLEMLANDESFVDTPVIIITGESSEAVVAHCKSVGADYVQKGPQLWEDLQVLICQRLHMTPPTDDDVPKKSDGNPIKPRDQLPTESRSRPTVLCIDDDPDITRVIKLRLEQYGLNVVSAFSGMQGFWTALETQPQVIICNLNMPDGEGNCVNGRLKSHPVTKDIPVIILTGQVNASLKREMFSLGVSAYLQKPLVFADLLATLKMYVPLTENTVQKTS